MKRWLVVLLMILLPVASVQAAETEKSWQEIFPLRPVKLIVNSPIQLSEDTVGQLRLQVGKHFKLPQYSIVSVERTARYLDIKDANYFKGMLKPGETEAVVLLDIQDLAEFTRQRFWSDELLLVVNVQMGVYMYTEDGKYTKRNTSYYRAMEYGMATRALEVTAQAIDETFYKHKSTSK